MPSTTRRRTGLAAMATSLVIGGTLAGVAPASAEADFDLARLSGDNRYDTSAKAAEAFGPARTVIIASGEPGRYPDALAANYLAGVKNAPVLLTRKNETPAEVQAAIRDSGARDVIIVGGDTVVSAAQEKELAKSYSVSRLAGSDRFATAAAVIAEGGDAQGDTALLATGMNFPDALGGGPVAFAEQMPLAITRPDDMPDNLVAALKKAGISKVLILGGQTAVGKAVEDELKDAQITVEKRFAGDDRAETSALLAEYALATYPDFDERAVNVASGYVKGDGADALGGAALTGKQRRALLITKSSDDAGEAVLGFFGEHADTLTEGTIFGGTAALTTSAEAEMEKAVLGAGAQNARTGELYNDAQAALDEAEAGDTITVFGKDNAGFTVTKDNVTVKAEGDASLSGAVVVQGADGVTVSGFTITPSSVANQVAGIYLDNAEDVTIAGNTVLDADNQTGAGVINVSGGEDEIATIRNNTFRDLLQGVYANPTAEFTVTDNVFLNNVAGSANDAASVVEGNRFVGNDEGIGLGIKGVEVKGNSFADNAPHVKDWTNDAAAYDLAAMIEANDFDDEVVVSEDETAIVDKTS